ncbi:MAG: hypothetical protein KJO52_00510 [Maribacter sp.]|nr:hypothetical protein [Maribacter sp.]
MQYSGLLSTFPIGIKIFIASFVIVLSIGFFTGIFFVNKTSSSSAAGIEENYLGNEDDDNAAVMKFKKSEREMLTIVHTHILSMSFIFFLLGILVWMTKLSDGLKLFLTVEPFFSVFLTFGGIYFLWTGVLWMKYLVICSGVLMTLTFTVSAVVVLHNLTSKTTQTH